MPTFTKAEKLVELIRRAGQPASLYVVSNETELAIGSDPLHPSHIIDLSREDIRPVNGTAAPQRSTSQVPTRRTGAHWVRVEGRQIDCTSLRDFVAKGLIAIDEARPGTLEKLSKIKLRSRRIVARDPKLLFDAPHLVEKFAAPLTDGWWFGTNNSAPEAGAWLERAFSCTDLPPGQDNRTSMTRWPHDR